MVTPYRIAAMTAVFTVMASVANANTGPAATGIYAAADNATTIAANPAGLARLSNSEWLLQGMYFSSESEFESTLTTPIGQVQQTEESDGSLFVPLLSYARPINDQLTVGVTTSGMSFGEDLGDDSLSRYFVQEWSLLTASLSPSFGYKVSDRLSVGASLTINYTNYTFESAIFNGIGQPDGQLELDATDINLSGTIGLLYEFSDRTRVGLSYRGQSDAELSDTPSGSITGTEISFDTRVPKIIGGGVYHELENGVSMTLDVMWIEFSEFGLSEITFGDTGVEVSDQNFEDVWGASAGFSWPLNNKWTLKGGVMATSQFIKDENRTRTFTMDAIAGIGAGVDYQWSDDKIVGFNLNYFDLGDGPVNTDNGLISYQGEYDYNRAIGIDVSLRWIR